MLKKRAQMFPLTLEDLRRERYHSMATFTMNTHDACYDTCAEDNELTFLSVPEGKCYRNCVTKISYLHPILVDNMQDTGVAHQIAKNEELRRKLGRPTPNLSVYKNLEE